jgi:hypothetical protein
VIDSQLFMGSAIAALCLIGLRFDRPVVEQTRKGKWLSGKVGLNKAIWIWRSILFIGFGFGAALACRWINPMN